MQPPTPTPPTSEGVGGGFRRRSTLHHAMKNKRVTVQGPVKKPQMDYMSHRGPCGGGSRAGVPGTLTYTPQNDPLVALIILNTHLWGF